MVSHKRKQLTKAAQEQAKNKKHRTRRAVSESRSPARLEDGDPSDSGQPSRLEATSMEVVVDTAKPPISERQFQFSLPWRVHWGSIPLQTSFTMESATIVSQVSLYYFLHFVRISSNAIYRRKPAGLSAIVE